MPKKTKYTIFIYPADAPNRVFGTAFYAEQWDDGSVSYHPIHDSHNEHYAIPGSRIGDAARHALDTNYPFAYGV
jgi:hypothetical protein